MHFTRNARSLFAMGIVLAHVVRSMQPSPDDVKMQEGIPEQEANIASVGDEYIDEEVRRKTFTVTFTENLLGITVQHFRCNEGARVEAVGSEFAKGQGIRTGQLIIRVGDTDVYKMPHLQMLDLIKTRERPINITFLQPGEDDHYLMTLAEAWRKCKSCSVDGCYKETQAGCLFCSNPHCDVIVDNGCWNCARTVCPPIEKFNTAVCQPVCRGLGNGCYSVLKCFESMCCPDIAPRSLCWWICRILCCGHCCCDKGKSPFRNLYPEEKKELSSIVKTSLDNTSDDAVEHLEKTIKTQIAPLTASDKESFGECLTRLCGGCVMQCGESCGKCVEGTNSVLSTVKEFGRYVGNNIAVCMGYAPCFGAPQDDAEEEQSVTLEESVTPMPLELSNPQPGPEAEPQLNQNAESNATPSARALANQNRRASLSKPVEELSMTCESCEKSKAAIDTGLWKEQ